MVAESMTTHLEENDHAGRFATVACLPATGRAVGTSHRREDGPSTHMGFWSTVPSSGQSPERVPDQQRTRFLALKGDLSDYILR